MAENFIRVKQINQAELSGYIAVVAGTGLTASTFVSYTGDNLVYSTGNQLISGIKSFNTRPQLSGTGFLISGEAVTISLLTQSGQALDAKINSLSGYSNNTFATTTNLFSTGSTLDSKINQILTGYVSIIQNQTISGQKSFAQRPSLSGSGFLLSGEALSISILSESGQALDSKINNLSGYINSSNSNIVFTTGNQLISGVKTFANNINFSGTGIFNGIDLNNIDILSLSGIDIYISNSNIFATVGTYSFDRLQAQTGVFISGFFSNVNSQSGFFTRSFVAPDIVYSTGNQTVSGVKNFIVRPTVDTTGVVVSGNNLFGTITLSHSNQSPANGGQTYYFAQAYASAPVTSTTDRRFAVPRNCTVRNFQLQIQTLGTYGVGAQPNVSYELYNYTTSSSVGTLFSCASCNPYTGVAFAGGGTGPFTGVQGVNVNFPLVTGNQYGIRWVFGGGYATAPTSVTHQVNLFLE